MELEDGWSMHLRRLDARERWSSGCLLPSTWLPRCVFVKDKAVLAVPVKIEAR